MPRINFPKYNEAVEFYFAGNLSKAQAFVESEVGSAAERGLVLVRLHNRKGEYEQAQSVLDKLPEPKDAFLSAEYFALSASISFLRGKNYEIPARLNLEALGRYESCGDRRGQFLTTYNLSADFNRLRLGDLSLSYLEKAKALSQEPSEQILVARALAVHYSTKREYTQALQVLKEILPADALLKTTASPNHEDALTNSDQIALYATAADIYIRAEKYSEARKLLELARKSRVNREKPKIEFLFGLLVAYMDRVSLGEKPVSVDESQEYSLKWNFIRAAQSGNLDQAQEIWSALVQLQPTALNPDLGFGQKSDEDSVFGRMVIEIYNKKKCEAAAAPAQIQSSNKGLQKLYDILQKHRAPVRKELLIEAIWQVPYDPCYDSRFYKLVERFKKQTHIKIHSVNRAYQLLS